MNSIANKASGAMDEGESVESSASTAALELHASFITDAPSSAQSSETSAVPESPEMTSAEREEEEQVEAMVETLEDLILEAYDNMQIDGEYIFLPDEVAEKLHRVAELMKTQEEQTENTTSAGEDSSSSDAAIGKVEVEEVKMLQQEDGPEPEQEQEQEKQEVHEKKEDGVQEQRDSSASDEEETRLRKVQALQAEAAEQREEKHKQRIPRDLSSENLFTELAPVPEVDESASSGPPSPSPPHSRSRSGANTPKPRAHTPARGPDHFPLISLSSTPSSEAASPDQIGKSPASRMSDGSGGAVSKRKVATYEMRREAALKLKADKKKRELLIRKTARKQREDAKRQLEEIHQKEMEEKKERVRRIREERLHRRTGKAAGAKGTSKKDC